MRLVSLLFLVLLQVFFAGALFGQTVSDADLELASQAQDELFIQDEDRRNMRDEDRAFRALEEVEEGAEILVPSADLVEGELHSFFIREIEMDGVSLLKPRRIEKLKKPYLGKELTINEINQLVRDVTEFYFKLGYITTRVYIVPQNLKEGTLKLQVMEGYVEGFDYDGPSTEVAFAFPLVTGKPFNLKHIEQGLDQMNRLYQNNAVMKIVPSTANVGAGVVRIENYKSAPGYASIRYDTYSYDDLSYLPNSFDVTRENILGINDQWVLNYYQRTEDREQFNNSLSLSASVPFGYFTGELSYSRFEYMTLVEGTNENFLTSGKTDTVELSTDMVLARMKKGKSTFSFGVETKDVVSYVEDTKSDTGSRKLVILNPGITQTYTNWLGNWTGSLNYYAGVLRLGATNTEDAAGTAGHAQFKKMVGDLYWVKTSYVDGYAFKLKSTFRTQYANKTLFSSERLTIGSYSSVRGYNVTAQGDRGFYWRNEMYVPNLLFFPRYSSLMLAADVGAVYDYDGQKWNWHEWDTAMASVSGGVTFNKGKMSVELVHGVPIKYTKALSPDDAVTTFSLTFGLM